MTLSLLQDVRFGVWIRRKTPGTVPKTGTSGLAVASDPIGFWEGVGPDCAVATPLFPLTDNVGRAKKKKTTVSEIQILK